MILIRAFKTEVLTDQKLKKLSSSASVLLRLVSQDTFVTAGMRSLVQYSGSFDSRYSVPLQEAPVTDIAEYSISPRLIQAAFKSICRR